MRIPTKTAIVLICVGALSSCATTIRDLGTTSVPGNTTTTTLPVPSGDIPSLLSQLSDSAQGLGQAIVDGDSPTYTRKRAEADAIWKVLEPQIRKSGLDLVDDVARIINFFHTAVDRKRPADADKAARFLVLIQQSVDTLLNK